MTIGRNPRKTLSTILLLTLVVYSSGCAQLLAVIGIAAPELKPALFDLATALGALMITINGLRWIASNQPEQRAECKKSIIYILTALILAANATLLVEAMYHWEV